MEEMEYEDYIDGPNQDIIDPITGNLIAKKVVRKKATQHRTYLALSDLRKNDGLKGVNNVQLQPPSVPSVQPQNNALLRGRVGFAPLPSGGGATDVPSNLQSYLHPQPPQQQGNADGYYNIQGGGSTDDIYQQIKQILFSMTNSNHLSNVGIVGAKQPATNNLGQKVDMLVGGQRPDSNELLTAGVDLNIPEGESRYETLNNVMKRIFDGFTDISGIQPEEVATTSGMSPFTEAGLNANIIPSGNQMVKTWQSGRAHSLGKQRYKPVHLVYIKGTHFAKGDNKVNPMVITHFLTNGHMAGRSQINKYHLLKVTPLHKNIFDKIGSALGEAVGSVSNLISSGVNDVLSVGNFVSQLAKVM